VSLDSLSPDPKRAATAAIGRAQADLEHAIQQIERLPAVDVHAIAVAAHGLTSFLTITGAVVDMLIPLVRDHPDRQVGRWLDGLAHATVLMTHTVSQLMNSSVSLPITLHVNEVDVVRLVERACAYYQRKAEEKAVTLRMRPAAGVPEIRTDHVLLAAIADSLLSNAITQSDPRTAVTVDVRAERDGVLCRVQDESIGPRIADSVPMFTGSAQGGLALGYGLAAAKRFVDQLGGEMSRETPAEGGTAIVVWLPRVRSISD
jgi:signal transduction histidine kinase